MRNSVKALVVLLTVFSTTLTQAEIGSSESDTYCSVKQVADRDVYRIVFQSQDEKAVQIKLFDARKKLIHTERVSAGSGFQKDFNLAKLPEGSYKFKVESGDYSFEKEVSLNHWDGKGLIISEIDGKVAIVGSNTSGSDLTVRISDEGGNELYEGSVTTGSELKQLFSFENVSSEKVRVSISDDYRVVKTRSVTL